MSKYVTVIAVSVAPFSLDATDAVVHIGASLAHIGAEKPDIVVLPELCDIPEELMPGKRGDLAAYLAARGDRVLSLLSDIARENRTYIVYNTLVPAGEGKLKNSTRMIDRAGCVIGQYDKCYVTKAEEAVGVLPGDSEVLFDCDFGKVAAIIGIDSEQKEIRRRYQLAKPVLTVHSSRRSAGLSEKFFAYNTRSYLVSACHANGTSAVILPVGEIISESSAIIPIASARVNLDFVLAHGDFNAPKLLAMEKKYGERATLYTPGNLGVRMATVESPDMTVEDIIKEFGIEPCDAFFERCLAKRRELKMKE
ncbi:MAG: carbon-nitrogen hydrolase family protein [Ruminococcaceae bacterium]|nr:carbon-nitrogen hydrolase family protein [Oscillospiraceae bacterium]